MRNRLPLGTVGQWHHGTVVELLLTSQRATNLAIFVWRSLRFHRRSRGNCIRNDFLSRLGPISYTFVIGADNMLPH